MNVLAISGSLRAASINTAFCKAAVRLAPAGLHLTVYDDLGRLPLFNPDLESHPPDIVARLRRRVGESDALLIASPEYAHGISGPMKNALDWLVAYEGFVAKPVAVINTSPRAHHAYASLLEILKTMSATLVHEASVVVPLLGAHITEVDMLDAPDIVSQTRQALVSLRDFVQADATGAPAFSIDV
jgi:NAD(P)H-dependent FMN reductase